MCGQFAIIVIVVRIIYSCHSFLLVLCQQPSHVSFPQARRDTKDEPWAWQSREYLRKKVIGKAVVFKVDYTVPSINREFGSVFLDDSNLAIDVVANGWARVSRLCIMQVGLLHRPD
jgi:endonuclease YncB( thermonuclease family)